MNLKRDHWWISFKVKLILHGYLVIWEIYDVYGLLNKMKRKIPSCHTINYYVEMCAGADWTHVKFPR